MTHLVEGPDLDQPAVAKNAHPVAKRLDLAEDVRRQEHGLADLAGLVDAMAKRLFHQRVQAAGGLVEQKQIGPRHQRGDEQHLLAVALGVGPHLLGRVEIKPLGSARRDRRVDVALDPPEEVQGLGAGERRPQVGLARHVGETTVGLHRRRWQSSPKISARPAVGRARPSSRRIVVVFPAPLGPR